MIRGEAYAFFYCKKPYEVVRTEVEDVICEMAQTPGLALRLYSPPNNLLSDAGCDRGLSAIVSKIIQAGINYGLCATLNGATNERTGTVLQDVLNLAYNDPALYEEGESFRAECCYWNGEEFVFA